MHMVSLGMMALVPSEALPGYHQWRLYKGPLVSLLSGPTILGLRDLATCDGIPAPHLCPALVL